MSFKGAIFDLDGVIVDTVPLHFKAWKRMFNEYGKEFSFQDYKQKVDGIPRVDGAKAILTDLPDEELKKACDKKQSYFLEYLKSEAIPVYETTVNLIKELKTNGVKVACISSSKNCPYILERSGLESLLDAKVDGNDITKGKPDPRIFLMAASRLSLRPEDCIVFEDALLGVEAASRAKMVCVGIDRHDDPDRLKKAQLIVKDLSEVNYDRLKSLFKGWAMRNYFPNYLSDDQWIISERGWDPDLQNVREVQFCLGNGYVGSRGILEEVPASAYPGTYIAGVYDQTGAQVTELVNAPNPVDFRIVAQGEKLDVAAMDVLEHSRLLDMQKGLLWRRTIYSNSKKKRFDYQSLRFYSMDDPHLGAMRIYLTPLDGPTEITVQTTINTAVTNKGVLTEGKKRHFQITEVSGSKGINYLCTRTFEKEEISIAYASCLMIHKSKRGYCAPGRTVRLRLKKDQTVSFTKLFSIYTSYDIGSDKVKRPTIQSLRKATKYGFEKLLDDHTKKWSENWERANIEIKGDPDVERALRFNIYHLLIGANANDGKASIGAKSLSGEGYRGHVFWDTEIFMLPFFIYTNPQVAKSLLLYRHNRLNEARRIASYNGFKGAQFPWESADTGREVTPSWYKDFDGSIIKIRTMEMEHHITADIAYATDHYYQATGDENFLLKYGLEIIFEAARFWASRVEYNKKEMIYEIKCVIGPDEFHMEVDNNAFTNAMASWNLLRAGELYKHSKLAHPKELNKLAKHIGLTDREVKQWRRVGRRIKLPYSKKRNLIEAFDGYFKKKEVPITQLDDNLMPIFPKGLQVNEVGKTRLVKQADVVMLLYLLPNLFKASVKKRNYLYYKRRTLHKSSLSSSIHAIAGIESGDKDRAFRHFLHSLNADLKNIHGNTSEGIHAASLGGTWQAAITGFAGMRIRGGVLSFNPKLPTHWKKLSFTIKWKGFDLAVSVFRRKVELIFSSPKRSDKLKVRVYGNLKELPANKLCSYYMRGGLIS